MRRQLWSSLIQSGGQQPPEETAPRARDPHSERHLSSQIRGTPSHPAPLTPRDHPPGKKGPGFCVRLS